MYRKLKGRGIFNGYEILDQDNVLILDPKGRVIEITTSENAGDNIETVEGLVCPGFINAHCHLELSHLRGIIPPGTGLVNFVAEVMKKRTEIPGEEIVDAMHRAEEEMAASGIVAVGDICNTDISIGIKLKSKLYWKNFIEVSGFVDAGAAKRLAEALRVKENFIRAGLKAGIVPHASYSVSRHLFELINDQCDEIITIHNQESAAEDELYLKGDGDMLRLYKLLGIDISDFKPSGKSSLKSWLHYFNRKQKIISVHNTFTDAGDVEFASKSASEVFWCLCVNANEYIERTLPPIGLFDPEQVVIGTDSFASNNQLNIQSEIKTIREKFPAFELRTVLKWATINGARALGIDDRFGSFEPGKTPGVVIID